MVPYFNYRMICRVALGFLAIVLFPNLEVFGSTENMDSVIFGDSSSEQNHSLAATRSEVFRGGLGEPARKLLPLEPVSHNGGSVSFRLKVDPEQQNYVTVKLWGSDCGAAAGRLLLFIEGLQLGYRHEGDHDVLNQCDEEPLFPGRFFYQTVALPKTITQGKREVTLKIAALGEMWSYGATFSKKQRQLTQPSRGIYRVYSHTATSFTPGSSEQQGKPGPDNLRPAGNVEVLLKQMKQTVVDRVSRLLNESPKTGAHNNDVDAKVLLLGESFQTSWTPAFHNPKAIAALIRWGDEYLKPGVIGSNWIGAGPLGEALLRVGPNADLERALNEEISVSEGLPFVPVARKGDPLVETENRVKNASSKLIRLTRREAWARVLRASLDWQRMNGRRLYTNQSMIVDLNIYTANRGLMIIDPARALPEKQALRYFYEAVGLAPWLGNDNPAGTSEKPYGAHYWQFTPKGLSRELGYVGTYGETILKFVRDMAEMSGDENIQRQLIKIQNARMFFRYPSLDKDGYRTMKLASEIDNRTAHFPVSLGAYGIANVRESWWMELAAFTKDPVAVGAAQQCLADNQYLPRLEHRINDGDTIGMMRNVDDYACVKKLPRSVYRLPMSDGQPDFVFSDEQNAVLAIKHGDRRMFLNFYFRQEFGVSGVVRVFDLAPTHLHISNVLAQVEVNATGLNWERPDDIDFERNGGFRPPGENLHQAWKGEKLPIAKRPEDARYPEYGKWGPFVGKASFYWLRYGDYLFAINTTETETFTLPLPSGPTNALDLISQKPIELKQDLRVPPLSSVALYFGGNTPKSNP